MSTLICVIIIIAVYAAVPQVRKLILALLPFALFGIIYDSMRYFPNYEFNAIDTEGLFNKELSLFGILDGETKVIPSAYCQAHHFALADFLAGVFYLCWVPLPIAYTIYLFLTGRREWSIRLGMCFLFVNLIGFAGYYIHPASPPWYVLQHGFEPVLNTKGDVAGLGAFDAMIGIPVFHAIYSGNANIFAAMPSLHAAYMPITTFYAFKAKARTHTKVIFAVITLGIWCTAVYSAHHYILDVIMGILTAIIGFVIFEGVLMNTRWFRRFCDSYLKLIK